MSADEGQKKLNFIQNVLPKMILERNEDLKNHVFVKCTAEACSQLDGFMSAIYTVELVLKDLSGNEKLHQLIVKIMKGDKNFRDSTESSLQCSNEVYIYKRVIPYLQKFVVESGATLKPEWVPRVYYADYKVFPDLGEVEETVLALENLKPSGYKLGPRIDLDENHLRLMIKHIASYHAVEYAMRIKKDPMLDTLAKGLLPFTFLQKNGDEMESYKILYVVALERFFNIVDRDPIYKDQKEFFDLIMKLKEQYGQQPMRLMQKFLETDEVFSLILHGDYNRNNVLFQYDEDGNLNDIRMIDFQEVRYATPAIDLAFFMYMNMPANLRLTLWDTLLELYHETLLNTIMDILKCDKNDSRLEPYSLVNFLNHFKKFAFYGVMVGIHFIPWMACPEEECQQMSYWFEKDIKSPELRQLCQISGGSLVNDRITGIVRHSFEKGYMDIFN